MSHEKEDDSGGSITITSNLDGWRVANSEKGRYVGGSACSVTDAFLSAKRRCCLGYLERAERCESRQRSVHARVVLAGERGWGTTTCASYERSERP